MKELNKHIRTQTTAVNLFLQSILSIVMGFILVYNYNLFFTRVSIVVFAYFWFVMGMNFIQVMQNLNEGVKGILQEIFPFIAFGVAVAVYYSNINRIIHLIPPIMLMGTLILTISNLISFFQYRKEVDTPSIHFLLSALLNLGFGIFFSVYTYTYGHFFTGIRLIGLYLIFLGITLFLEGLSKAIPNKYIVKWSRFFRVTPPSFVTAFVPLTSMNRMQDYFEKMPEEITPLRVEKSDVESNVEVFVHVAKSIKGIAGHVDIAIGDTVICYGTYDREHIHLGGSIGAGVIYEVYNKEEYLAFCQEVRGETLFEYGLFFSEQELEQIKEKLKEVKSRTRIWKCKAQRAQEAKQDTFEAMDMSCKIATAMDTVFYKFNSGSYKYYWMFGCNCVRFTDDLLQAGGMMTVRTSIYTPGMYFTFLNDEFAKGNSKIVSRTVYYMAEKS